MIDAWSLSNLIAFSAQIAVIVAGGALVAALIPVDAPAVRYTYWRVLAGLCLVLPWLQSYQEVPALVVAEAGAATVAAVQDLGLEASPWSAVAEWTTAAGLMIAGGAAIRLAWLAAGLARLGRLRRAGRLADAGEHTDLQQMLGTRAEIRVVRALDQPVTFGCIRPVILVPASLLQHPVAIQRAVLAHELLHVQRRDWGWLVGEEIVRAALWFHPAMWWVISRVQRAREEVVDELAVLMTDGRKTYIEALLAYADDRPLAATAAFAWRRHLFSRMVLISREGVMSSQRIVVSCAAMALVVAASSRYAVSAFPLQNIVSGAQSSSSTAGPLERRAQAITPENPIPRRIGYVAPVFPDTVADARGTVTVQLTIDELGRVAESRVTGISLKGRGYSVSMSGDNARAQLDVALTRSSGGEGGAAIDASSAREAGNALIAAALTSIRQWRYDPPASGPLSFPITVSFGPTPAANALQVKPEGLSQRMLDGAIRVGGNINTPTKIRNVQPVYPPEAQEARIQGVVIIEVRIEADGRVSDAQVLRSIPMLDQAALDAVRQWEFTPTLLNGKAVPVIMTITVNFTLAG